jgi:hypothetical protein
MPGWLTDGMPTVSAPVQNGVTVTTGGINVNGVTTGGAAYLYSHLGAAALVAADTETTAGSPPQTVAATAWQIAAHAAPLFKNTATSTAGAATLSTVSGIIQTESLATAIGSNYTMVVTNSLVSTANTPPSPIPQVEMLSFSNTGGAVQINSITNAAGSFTVVFENVGTSVFNGTFLIPFHI